MADLAPDSKTFPLVSRGLILNQEPGLLEPGEFSVLRNIRSPQEGSIGTAFGSKKYTNAQTMGPGHSWGKLALGGADSTEPRYLGAGTTIWRITGPYTTAADISSTLVVTGNRWEALPFGVGVSSRPRLLIAEAGGNLQDNGTWSKARPWGIKPPGRPVSATPADPTLAASPGLKLFATHDASSSRLSTTVSSAAQLGGTYYQITPASMSEILQGMLVKLAAGGISSGYVLVDTADSTTFQAYCSGTPSGAINAFYVNVVGDGTIADGGTDTLTISGSVDWSFRGMAANGYDTGDNIRFGLNVSDLAAIAEVRIRIIPVSASPSDYYEKVLTPASFSGSAAWQEFAIPKDTWTKVGSVGSGSATWKSVQRVDVVVVAASLGGSPAFTVSVGAIFADGGQGPDSESIATAEPYDYLYTARDPETGAEGNPCAAMLDSQAVDVRGRAISVTYYGVDTDVSTGNPNLTGFGSIAIYRRGGVFADGYYRFVGYGTNPGVSGGTPVAAATPFVDNLSDDELAGNRTLEFDNYPPAPADLPIKFQATISSGPHTGGTFSTLTLTGFLGAPNTYISLGSSVTVGSGGSQETCVVLAVSSTQISVYIQNNHYTGEQVESSVYVGKGCDLICQAGDSVLIAGDDFNPHVIYRSKAGRPDAFPIINLASGNSHKQIVGSPANPIYGIVEYSGEFVVLNKTSVSTFQIFQGRMTNPKQTPANRGLVAKHVFCKVDNMIVYLSYDGIYAWSGGESTKITEQVDGLFNGQTVNGIPPVDYLATNLCWMEFHRNHLYFAYRDTGGDQYILRYSMIYKRWEPLIAELNAALVFQAMFSEEDTGKLLCAVYDNGAGKTFVHEMLNGTSYGWIATPSDGLTVDFLAKSGWFAPGGRTMKKQFTDIVLEIENPSTTVTVSLYYDYSGTADATDTFTITAAAGRRWIPLPLQQSGGNSVGKEAHVVAVEISGLATAAVNLYAVSIGWVPMAEIQRGKATDWMDLGHPHDKRLYRLELEYDTKGQAVTLTMDTITGTNTVNLAVQTFSINSNGRAKYPFPVIDGVVCKMVRLRPSIPTSSILIHEANFQKEDYPPDIVPFTEPTDKGTPFDKYWQQLTLDVNTNGQTVPVNIEVDGSVAQTVSVNSTLSTRQKNITLNRDIKGKKARIYIGTVPGGGMFQLWTADFVAAPADRGAVLHTGDWQDEGTPFDKHLSHMIVEYESSGGTHSIQVDTLTGINGTVQNLGALSFTLSGTGRSKHTFPIPDGFIAKMMRVRPAVSTNPTDFKIWGAQFKAVTFPPDIIYFTEWDDFGYEYDKILNQITLDVDTGGIAASVQVQADGGTIQTLGSVTTSTNNREAHFVLNPSLTGKRFRLLVTPGANGKFQLFGNWRPKFQKGDRGAVEHSFDWDDLGHPYDKKLTEVTFEWDTGGGSVTMLMDTITGDGTVQNLGAQSFVLSAAGRSKRTFPIVADTIAKMIRIRPSSTFATLKVWKYEFARIPYPADIIATTEWSDEGWPCDKVMRGVSLNIDTGGVACTVEAQADGVTVESFSVTTTALDRERFRSFGTGITERMGKLWRLKFTPGIGGKAEYFNHKFDTFREPCARTHWDSGEVVLGAAGWKHLRQIWLEYQCAGQVTLSIYRDGGQLFDSKTLPAHSTRSIERFFLKKKNGLAYNKSKTWRFVLDAVDSGSPFKFYIDGGRIESKQYGSAQRAAAYQNLLWQALAPTP